MSTIGFVGLGNMGEPMVRRLAGAGHQLRVYDAAPAAVERLAGTAGVVPVPSTVDVADGADVVVLMLPDSNVVEHVLLANGLLDRIAGGAVLVDMSSSVPTRTKALAERAAKHGVTLVDAPVSGGVGGAEGGTLTIMVGGPRDTYDRLLPILSVLGSRVLHAGDTVGAGHAVKALNNLMSATHLMVTAEAMRAGREFGLDPAVVLDIVNTSSGRSGSTEQKFPRFVLPGTYDSGFGLRLMLKDMKVAVELARATGTPAPLSEAAVAVWQAAADATGPGADHTEIARWVDERERTEG
jgi:3-hydroxyisobutyrate dehydrogenase